MYGPSELRTSSPVWEWVRLSSDVDNFVAGMFHATLAPFLLAIVGPSQLPSALGYTNLINGLAAFAGIRISGKKGPRSYDQWF